jgi:hypothetical protein
MAEMPILRKILLACSRGPARLFRNHVGAGWTGKTTRFSRSATVIVEPGDVLIRNARPLTAGLCVGSSDLIGWRSVRITPDMVGELHALFVACEVKDRGKVTAEQQRFLDAVQAAGGIALVARSVEEAEAALG